MSAILGRVLSGVSIGWFLIIVYLLHLNEVPAIWVAGIGMAVTKLMWDIAEGLRYASRIHQALMDISDDPTAVEQFVRAAHSHRQTQDLRGVALTIYAPDSRQMRLLDEIITKQSEKSA